MYSIARKNMLVVRWILCSVIMVTLTLHEIRCEVPVAGEFADSSESSESEVYTDDVEAGFFTEARNYTGVDDTDQQSNVNRTRPRLLDLSRSGQINETKLEDDIFENAPHLRSIKRQIKDALCKAKNGQLRYIFEAPMLRRLPPLPMLPELRTVRVINSGLEEIPDLRHIHGSNKNSLLHMIDIVGNRINKIPSYTFRVRADQLILDSNQIEEISAYAFKGSELRELSLKGNSRLTRIHDLAFADVKMIRELDLSGTAITNMPTRGLERLEVLLIEDVPSLKVIPSVYEFQHLTTALLTHHFHCCAFKFPARHDPARHAKHEKEIAAMQQKCEKNKKLAKTSKRYKRHVPATSKTQELGFWSDSKRDKKYNKLGNIAEAEIVSSEEQSNESEEYEDKRPASGFKSGPDKPDLLQDWGKVLNANDDEPTSPPFMDGTFHNEVVELDDKDIEAYCGNITIERAPVRCTPVSDALNPCEDVMGWRWLRLSVWLVVAAALGGNAAVAVVLLAHRSDFTVPKMLMCHLCFADLCTGLYLLMLAAVDVASYGEYFNYAYDWQNGPGCKIAGFLSVFSGQLSVYALAVITLERWFAITFAIYLNRRIDLKAATQIMIGGWIFALTMAGLPLVGVSDFSSTSICLPAQNKNRMDAAYQAILFATSATAFAVIVVCYIQIYRSLGTDTRRNSTQSNDRSIAKKMSLLVATDFLCWAPVAFFGVTALAGFPLVDVSHSKVLLVFFYPLNACANPFLYAILTQQYQRDFVFLLARYGLCTKMAQKYKMGYSLPTTNNSHPVPLIARQTLETSVSKDLLPVAEATL